jgi:hypothetical protein
VTARRAFLLGLLLGVAAGFGGFECGDGYGDSTYVWWAAHWRNRRVEVHLHDPQP